MKLLITRLAAALAILALGFGSCTDLSDDVYSEVTDDSFAKDPSAAQLIVGDAYAGINLWVASSNPNWTPFYYNIATADEMIIPHRKITNEWKASQVAEMYKHSWNANTTFLKDNWDRCFQIISKANFAIDQVNSFTSMKEEDRQSILAELRMIRAYGYYIVMDLWGDVPFITSFSAKQEEIEKKSSADIYRFMMTEFEECLPLLSKNTKKGYGKFNYYAALALKAKYLINANVFLDTQRDDFVYPFETEGLDECIRVCTEIIRDGGYDLEPDYFTNFKAANESSRENIFVIPFDQSYSTDNKKVFGFGYARHALHVSQVPAYGASCIGTAAAFQNGWSCLPSMYHSFAEGDGRINGWMVGLQTYNGEPLKCKYAVNKNKNLDFTVDWDIATCNEADGARFIKYEYEKGLVTNSMNNDFVVIRLADILLTKAEAIMRKNGGTPDQEAVGLVNRVRNRSFADTKQHDYYTIDNLNMDALLNERKLEFYGEGFRRTDLIRFHRFINGTWENLGRQASEPPYLTVFPIPQAYLESAPNIEQHSYYK